MVIFSKQNNASIAGFGYFCQNKKTLPSQDLVIFLKTEKRFLAKFLESPSDCSYSNCQHNETSFEDLKKTWSSASYQNQCQFMVFLAQDIKTKIRKDIESNISQFKRNGIYCADALGKMGLKRYLKDRESRLVCFLLGLNGKNLDSIGDDLPRYTFLIESFYNIASGSIMPLRYKIYSL